MSMTEDQITALVERIVDEKLRERDRKMVAAIREGAAQGVHVALDGAKLNKQLNARRG